MTKYVEFGQKLLIKPVPRKLAFPSQRISEMHDGGSLIEIKMTICCPIIRITKTVFGIIGNRWGQLAQVSTETSKIKVVPFLLK